jgi:hypothetical protein
MNETMIPMSDAITAVEDIADATAKALREHITDQLLLLKITASIAWNVYEASIKRHNEATENIEDTLKRLFESDGV